MSNVALAKPSTFTSAIISCTKLGTGGTDFFIKVMRVDIEWSDPPEPSTGDGDAARALELTYMPYVTATLYGFMVAHSVSGSSWDLLTNLKDAAKNPLAASMKLNAATSEVFTMPKGLIHRGKIRYDRGSGTLPLVLVISETDSNATWGDT